MKKQNMGLGIRTWGVFIFVAALLVSTLHTTGIYAEEVTPEDKQAYKEALEDTETATQAEIFRGLLAVVPGPDRINYERLHGDQIELANQDASGGSPVKVVTFLSMDSYKYNYEKKIGKVDTLTKSIWVTVVPEMKNFFVGQQCPPTKQRIKQVLGLNPAWEFDVLVELWVNSKDLFRPTPDPEITDHEGELSKIKKYKDVVDQWTFPSELNAFLTIDDDALFLDGYWVPTQTFKEWFIESANEPYSTEGEIANWRAPWTRLGYSYDWGNKDNHVGLSEFLVRINPYDGNLWVQYGRAIIHGTPEWDEHFRCGPGSPMLSATTSGAGVALSWTSVSGADGYNLRYKEAQRGAPFTPPFADDATVDLENMSKLDIPLPSGSCYYVAVQSYDDRGAGGLSNIEYVYVP
jgi:hypothetical protein